MSEQQTTGRSAHTEEEEEIRQTGTDRRQSTTAGQSTTMQQEETENEKPTQSPNEQETKNGIPAGYECDSDDDDYGDDDVTDNEEEKTIWREGGSVMTITKSGTITWR